VVRTSDGTISQRIDYDPWGVASISGVVGLQPFGFAGGIYDPDTGLVRFGARDYLPEVGRWISKDPVRFRGGLNLFAYANNNAVNFIDSDGKDPLMLASGAAAIFFWSGFCLRTAYEQAEAAYGSDDNGGSSKRHCYANCLASRCTMNQHMSQALGFAYEVMGDFQGDWKQDLIDNYRGSQYAFDTPWKSCTEACDPDFEPEPEPEPEPNPDPDTNPYPDHTPNNCPLN
jgi:RHS repeat-associated protein